LTKEVLKRRTAQFNIMVKLSRELMRRGRSVHPKIRTLFESDDPHVRMWGAFLAFEFDAPEAERLLADIGRNCPGPPLSLGFTARFTLEQWRKGELRTLSQWGCKSSTAQT
jgi:hypothetical protein